MNDLDVNKIIAEFMGHDPKTDDELFGSGNIDILYHEVREGHWKVLPRYTQYLDNLVPVWENLRLVPEFEKTDKGWYAKIITTTMAKSSSGETIQQTAAYATAKAILEIK